MRPGRLLLEDGRVLSAEARLAGSAAERLRGWLLRGAPGPEEALVLRPCAAVHSLGMRFRFDLAFLDAEGRVLSVRAGLAPGRLALASWGGLLFSGGRWAVELPQGRLAAFGVGPGARLRFQEA